MGEQLFTWADPGFFLGGGALVSCSTSIPINHIVFCFLQNTSCIRKPRVISGGLGGNPLHPPPKSAPVFIRQDCVTSTCCCVYKSCYLYYLLCRQNKSEVEQHQFWKAVQCTVDKDVVRTDRSHPYFSGDNNPNVAIMRY